MQDLGSTAGLHVQSTGCCAIVTAMGSAGVKLVPVYTLAKAPLPSHTLQPASYYSIIRRARTLESEVENKLHLSSQQYEENHQKWMMKREPSCPCKFTEL